MGAAYFYHLTYRPLEETLPALLTRARGAGWRVLVRGTSAERIDWLDKQLWTGADPFLPHGVSGGEFDADQPVLLTTDATQFQNNAECLMTIDGAEILPAEVEMVQRACVLFDGNDEVALNRARSQWRDLTRAGCAAQYWSEADGKWEMKAESKADDSA